MDYLKLLPLIFGVCFAQYGGPSSNLIDVCHPSSDFSAVSEFCSHDKACVEHNLCVNGYIDIFGSSIIQKRNKNVKCSFATHCCCKIPEDLIDNIVEPPKQNECDIYYDCVNPLLCTKEGKINTGGIGLINKRTKLTLYEAAKCTSLNYDITEGVCCLRPEYDDHITGALGHCWGNQVCVDEHNCEDGGYNVNSITSCYINGGSNIGICCGKPRSTNPVSPPTVYPPHTSSCGVKNTLADSKTSPHTLREHDAFFGQFPHQAIIFDNNFVFKCGASLISDQFLLTAAHCVDGLQPYDLLIRLGEYQVDTFDEFLNYQDFNIVNIYIHENYNAGSNQNGIAVIKIEKPVTFDYHINPICLPSNSLDYFNPVSDYHFDSAECYVSGWGKDSFYGSYTAKLKAVDVPLLNGKYCQDLLQQTRLSQWFKLDQKSFLCAGGRLNEDACKGDGGGPLTCWNRDLHRYELVGIVSWGIDCGHDGVPGVYVNVFNYISWINGITGLHL